MNPAFRRTAFLLMALCALYFAILLSGCSSQKTGDKPGEDMNSAMSAQQKALIAEHKKKGEQ